MLGETIKGTLCVIGTGFVLSRNKRIDGTPCNNSFWKIVQKLSCMSSKMVIFLSNSKDICL